MAAKTYYLDPFAPFEIQGQDRRYTFADFDLVYRAVSPQAVERTALALRERRFAIHDRPLDDAISALDELGQIWGSTDSPWRQEALAVLPTLTRQSREMVKHELDMVCQLLWRPNLEDWVVRELGSLDILEGWVQVGDVLVHRQPRGLIFHNLAGNAFIVSALSVIFNLLSKNVALLKVSQSEPYFGVRFAESLRQVDSDLARGVAVLYWPSENKETYKTLFETGLGAAVAWGETTSVTAMAKYAAQTRTHFVDHGPKLGFEVIEKPNEDNAHSLAYSLALDIVPWEQYACLSPRVVFVQDGEVDAESFAELTAQEMNRVSQELPNDKIGCERASPTLSNREFYTIKLEMAGLGRLFESAGADWTVVYSKIMPTPEDINSCQGRFIMICRIESLEDVIAFLDEHGLGPYLQTLGYNGSDLDFIQAVTLRGVSDVTLPGQVNVKPLGSSHDGLYNLAELTYVVSRHETEAEKGERLPWDETAAQQFERLLALTPSLFRQVSRATISQEAEENARQRESALVEEWDMVHAYLQETPEVFKPQLFDNAVSVGIDMERYLTRERILQMQDLSGKMAWEQVQRQFHPDVTWFEWCVTDRCNLRCKYCYEGAGAKPEVKDLSTEQALKIIRSLGQSSRTLDRQFVICFSGGEPLLRQDLLQLIACADEQDILVSIATNGCLLTPEMAARLKELNVADVLISVDSLEPEIHDSIRGKGSHAQALKAIEHCKEVGLLTLVETVATRYNWQEIAKLKRWAEEEVGALFFYRAAIQIGRGHGGELLMSAEQYQRLYYERNQEVFDKLDQGKGLQIPLMSIFDLVPFPHTPATKKEQEYLEWGVGCQACRLLHGISATGELLPCIRFKLPLGNLLEEDFISIADKELYRKIALREERGGICADCEHVAICGGGCLAEVMSLKDDPFAGWDRCRWVTENGEDE